MITSNDSNDSNTLGLTPNSRVIRKLLSSPNHQLYNMYNKSNNITQQNQKTMSDHVYITLKLHIFHIEQAKLY